MSSSPRLLVAAAIAISLFACREPEVSSDASKSIDASFDAAFSKDADCASMFGNKLTDSHGRIDGTVVAIVNPGNSRCALPNRNHVVVQVRLLGAVYRMVVNVESNGADPKIRTMTKQHPLVGGPFAEGWYPENNFDYATDLAVHNTDAAWAPKSIAEATTWIADAINIGDPISIFATSGGGTFSNSAHLVHRDGVNTDGALVVTPTTNPTYLLFSFADQTF
jgi:hypothetical protein